MCRWSVLGVLRYGALCLCAFLLTDCGRSDRSLASLSLLDAAPMLTVDSLEITYTEHGRVTARMRAPRMLTYAREGVSYDEFLDGVHVEFLNEAGQVSSSIVSGYAMHWRDRSLWEARYRVVAVNPKGDTMRTEHLFWDQREHRIYSHAIVRVRTRDAELFGRGFASDERFEQWVFREPQGVISIAHGERDAYQE